MGDVGFRVSPAIEHAQCGFGADVLFEAVYWEHVEAHHRLPGLGFRV